MNAVDNCIALIPAYEPEALLIDLLCDVQRNGLTAVVVDDGSGSSYSGIFARASLLSVVLTHEANKGKGRAIKTGLSYISEHYKGNYVVVTLDADGQHRVSDAVKICKMAQDSPDMLVLGSRKLKDNVPVKSRFGNTVTRCVYYLSTGLHIHDTQTGLRAFSSSLIPFLMNVAGERYEYEMNVLLECPYRNIPVKEAGIDTIYLDNNSASHFDMIRDSYRVYREIIKFSASSFISFLVDYGAYILMLAMTSGLGSAISLRISNIAARIISASVNYTINRRLVFKSDRGIMKSILQYFALAAVILAGNTFLLGIFAEKLGMNRYVSKIITELAFFTMSWLVQRYLIFRRKGRMQKYEG